LWFKIRLLLSERINLWNTNFNKRKNSKFVLFRTKTYSWGSDNAELTTVTHWSHDASRNSSFSTRRLPVFQSFRFLSDRSQVMKCWTAYDAQRTGWLQIRFSQSSNWRRRSSMNSCSNRPAICLPGNGGMQTNRNLFTNCSCSQSNCLYRRPTSRHPGTFDQWIWFF